ncbi:hypothetical protein [Agrococcus carbonis]|uniref:Uncharacterized protein n=1 Tax=Agrococcus carbonis TaxID=684552 RepID=A0A1H1PYV9_9MICO|nr:hypothetical protein [Agrococcus carbonis]SDS16294.1 hypothetical protein SAMN04489719_1683 [Agrococcus carbonis]
MITLWATRGRDWGFRFLIRPSHGIDPLALYERAFSDHPRGVVISHIDSMASIRLLDPEGRLDRSGRRILHEFVVDGPVVRRIASVDDAERELWPFVARRYESLWAADRESPALKPLSAHPTE